VHKEFRLQGGACSACHDPIETKLPRFFLLSISRSSLTLTSGIRGNKRRRDISLTTIESSWVRRDIVGGRWATPKEVIRDIALGAGLWAVWIALMNPHVLGGGTNAAEGLLPRGILESLAWIPLALSAGFCEELAFRGYLQRQFQAIAGSAALAVLFQAIVFGVGHLYEGVGAATRITLFGVLFGLLAVWRKSLRPGMIAHAWSDIFGVIVFRGM
jgi:membrane protease YdiL (CAAX protease family)